MKESITQRTLYLLSKGALLLPLMAAYLVYPTRDSLSFLSHFLELQVVFISTFISWGTLRELSLLRISSVFSEYSKFGRLLITALLIVLIVWVLASLTGFRKRATDELFFIALGAMTIGGLAEVFERRRLFWVSSALFLAYFWAVSYVSFLIRLGEHLWQPALFCLGPAAACVLIRYSFRPEYLPDPLDPDSVPDEKKNHRPSRFAQTVAILMICAPFAPSLLVYAGQLGVKYLITFAILPLLPSTMAMIKAYRSDSGVAPQIHQRLQLIAVLYTILIICSRLL